MPEEVPLNDAADVQFAVVAEKSLLQFSVQREVFRLFVQPEDFRRGIKRGKTSKKATPETNIESGEMYTRYTYLVGTHRKK